MINQDGWFDWMIPDPCPLDKTNGGVNTCKIVVPHSAEGYWPYLQELAHDRPDASWMFSNLKDGRCFQHYSIYAQVWGSGSGYPNNNGVMWENEGVAGEPLTDAQVDNCVRIIYEVSQLKGWIPERPRDAADKNATLYEHKECVRWGSKYTECPSGRIPWDRILEGLMGVSSEEFGALFALVLKQGEQIKALATATFKLAGEVYGETDDRLDELEQQVALLEADDK